MDKDIVKSVVSLCTVLAWAYLIFYVVSGFGNVVNYAVQITGTGRLGGLGVILIIFIVLAVFIFLPIALFGIISKK